MGSGRQRQEEGLGRLPAIDFSKDEVAVGAEASREVGRKPLLGLAYWAASLQRFLDGPVVAALDPNGLGHRSVCQVAKVNVGFAEEGMEAPCVGRWELPGRVNWWRLDPRVRRCLPRCIVNALRVELDERCGEGLGVGLGGGGRPAPCPAVFLVARALAAETDAIVCDVRLDSPSFQHAPGLVANESVHSAVELALVQKGAQEGRPVVVVIRVPSVARSRPLVRHAHLAGVRLVQIPHDSGGRGGASPLIAGTLGAPCTCTLGWSIELAEAGAGRGTTARRVVFSLFSSLSCISCQL